jgi:hypothetical protein
MARSLDGEIPQIDRGDWTVARVDAFDGRVDELWDRVSGGFALAMVRNKERLNYRFADARAGNYRMAVAEQGGHLLGYVVYSWWRGVGQLADLLVLPERLDVLQSLLGVALRDLRTIGNTRVECWTDLHHVYNPAFIRLELNELVRRQRMTLHALHGDDDGAAFFADPKSRVHLMAGDTDLV